MAFHIVCIDAVRKSDNEYPLYERYVRRQKDIHLHALKNGRQSDPCARKAEESALLLAKADSLKLDYRVALCERGKLLGSVEFSETIARARGIGKQEIGFFIGGAYGLAPELVKACDLHLAFGKMTWPHKMVQVMLAEQIYRAMQILTGHPYHKP